MEGALAGLDVWSFAVVAATVAMGAVVQGSIGIGFGIVLVPVLALVAPDTLPATALLLTLPLAALTAYRERAAIYRPGLPALFVGRILGTAAAVGLLVVLSEAALEILFGLVIIGVVGLSVSQPHVPFSRASQVGAGATSGLFATTAAIGGPPMALLYQHRPGPELRATLGTIFLLGGALSLGGLVLADRLEVAHAVLALLLVPAMFAGFLLSRPLARVLDARWLRPAVLTFAAAGGVLALVRGLLG